MRASSCPSRAQPVVAGLSPRTVMARGALLSDEQATVAVLKVNLAGSPPPLPLGSTAYLRVGQNTFAIGNPFGRLDAHDWHRVGARSIPAERGRAQPDRAADSDGCGDQSGQRRRPVARQRRAADRRQHRHLQSVRGVGVGFAIPADTVNRVVPQLIAAGATSVRRSESRSMKDCAPGETAPSWRATSSLP